MLIQVFEGGPFAENTLLVMGAGANGDDSGGSAGEAFIVDPGWGAKQALAEVERRGLHLSAVLLTHAHVDHVDGLVHVRAVSDAPIHLHPDDRELYEAAPAQAAHFGLRMDPLPSPDRDLVAGQSLDLLGRSWAVRHTPGHAPGHVIFYSEADGVCLSGDVIFQGSIGRTDLPGGDFRTLIDAIRSEVLTLPDDTTLYPGHGPTTTVRWERTTNPFLVPHYGGELV